MTNTAHVYTDWKTSRMFLILLSYLVADGIVLCTCMVMNSFRVVSIDIS